MVCKVGLEKDLFLRPIEAEDIFPILMEADHGRLAMRSTLVSTLKICLTAVRQRHSRAHRIDQACHGLPPSLPSSPRSVITISSSMCSFSPKARISPKGS